MHQADLTWLIGASHGEVRQVEDLPVVPGELVFRDSLRVAILEQAVELFSVRLHHVVLLELSLRGLQAVKGVPPVVREARFCISERYWKNIMTT